MIEEARDGGLIDKYLIWDLIKYLLFIFIGVLIGKFISKC